MKRFVITEDEKKRIMGLYEQPSQPESYSYEVGKSYKMKRDIDGKEYNVKILRADENSTPPNWYETEIDGGIGIRELAPNYKNPSTKGKGLEGNTELGTFYDI